MKTSMRDSELYIDSKLKLKAFNSRRYWNRLPYRHRFDVVSVSALLLLQLSAIFRHRAPDWLVRTASWRDHPLPVSHRAQAIQAPI